MDLAAKGWSPHTLNPKQYNNINLKVKQSVLSKAGRHQKPCVFQYFLALLARNHTFFNGFLNILCRICQKRYKNQYKIKNPGAASLLCAKRECLYRLHAAHRLLSSQAHIWSLPPRPPPTGGPKCSQIDLLGIKFPVYFSVVEFLQIRPPPTCGPKCSQIDILGIKFPVYFSDVKSVDFMGQPPCCV